MKSLAIIPARGGSKSLVGKNLKEFMGRPLIAWTIEAALKSEVFSRIVVSTDSSEIAEVAKACGAEVPFLRPEELATDKSSSVDVVTHCLEALDENFSTLCLLQPTSPLRQVTDIVAAEKIFADTGAPALLSVTELDHPIEWALELEAPGAEIQLYSPEKASERRQDLPKRYRPNGALFFVQTEAFLAHKSFRPSGTRAYVMPKESSFDIDEWYDLVAAEAVAKELFSNK